MSEDGSDSSDLNKSTNPPGTGTRSSVAGTGGAATPPDIVMKHAPGSWQALAAGQFTSDGLNVDTRRAELSGEGADLDAGDRVGDRGHLGDPSQTTVIPCLRHGVFASLRQSPAVVSSCRGSACSTL